MFLKYFFIIFLLFNSSFAYQFKIKSVSLRSLIEKEADFWYIDNLELLKNNPTETKELAAILQQLNITPNDLIRKGEAIYKEIYKDKTFTNAEWIQIMVNNPILIERPIIVNGDKAVIGRPPEKVLEIL